MLLNSSIYFLKLTIGGATHGHRQHRQRAAMADGTLHLPVLPTPPLHFGFRVYRPKHLKVLANSTLLLE